MGEIMELIKDFLIIIGIFVCMSLGIFFLLHSGDAKKKTKQTVQDTRDSIQETNQQLDDVLEQLQENECSFRKSNEGSNVLLMKKFYQKNNRGMLTKLKYYL